MRVLLPLYGLVLAAFAAGVLYFFKAGLDDYVASNSLAGVQVSAPEGWTVRPYMAADGAIITQTTAASGAEGTTREILAAYDIPTGGLRDGGVTTFQRGDELIALRLNYAPHQPKRASLFERMGRKSTSDADRLSQDAIFATLSGLPVIEEPRLSWQEGEDAPVPVNYRYFTTTIGDQKVDEVLEISVLTNSSDAAVATVLGGLDIAALNGRLPTPDPRVIAAAGLLTRDALPLSDEPPRPTPAYRAMQLVQSGKSFDPPWQEALLKVRNGQILSWNDLQSRYPRIDTLPFELLEVFDDGSHDNAARYFAAILSTSGRAWSGHEIHVLSKVAEMGTTQADLAEYLAGEFEVAPEVLALAKRLPVAPEPDAQDTQVVRSGAAPATGLRNAASCVIQNGVRRCVVGSN